MDFQPDSGNHYVRPQGVGELLGRIFQILRAQVRTFLTLGLAPVGVMLAMYVAMFGGMYMAGMLQPQPNVPPDPVKMLWLVPFLLLAYAVLFVAYVMFEAAATRAALEANRGGSLQAAEVWPLVKSHTGRMVGLFLMRFLYVLLPAIAVGVAAAILSLLSQRVLDANAGALFLLWPLLFVAILGAIAWLVWMMLRLALAVPVCLMENTGVMDSMHRSAELTRGAKGRIFVVFLVLYLAAMGAIMALEFGILILAGIGAGLNLVLHLGKVTAGIGIGTVAVVFVLAVLVIVVLQWTSYAVAFAVLYDDQKLRLEGIAPPMLSTD